MLCANSRRGLRASEPWPINQRHQQCPTFKPTGSNIHNLGTSILVWSYAVATYCRNGMALMQNASILSRRMPCRQSLAGRILKGPLCVFLRS